MPVIQKQKVCRRRYRVVCNLPCLDQHFTHGPAIILLSRTLAHVAQNLAAEIVTLPYRPKQLVVQDFAASEAG